MFSVSRIEYIGIKSGFICLLKTFRAFLIPFSLVNLLHICRIPFYKNTYRGHFLNIVAVKAFIYIQYSIFYWYGFQHQENFKSTLVTVLSA